MQNNLLFCIVTLWGGVTKEKHFPLAVFTVKIYNFKRESILLAGNNGKECKKNIVVQCRIGKVHPVEILRRPS
ncbi:MAG: hypothetical protein CDV28_1162 [Candidatus Electronema aureum]|uniref:Uncharacterized protein n=1 Tax=Candidatus Electronema aureum TaxID=2005002 RepID=A0A521G1E5_9BACT|nr:MAG: hypothetical protein CDV28_1162 [Candidatus Electronema aureum]